MKVTSFAAPRAARGDVKGLRVPERTLALLRDLVAGHAGIYYDDDRFELLRDRLAPLAIERSFDSLLDYYYLLKYDAAAVTEWPRVLDALAVQETYFWREADQFHALAAVITPMLVQSGRAPIRIWSIPCASGEEPLSIAMALNEAGWFDRAAIEIHAADASEAALARARRRRYGLRSFRQLPPALRDKYFTRDADLEQWTVSDGLFNRITSWRRANVMQPGDMAGLAGSDVVFCRNLFIYFTPAAVREVTARFVQWLRAPGYLCVGASESLLRTGSGLELQDLGGAYVYVKP